MSKDGINSKDFIIGTLIGGIIGATTALFLTPKSGKELRNNLNEQATSVKEKTEKWKNTAVERGTELVAATKEKSSDLVGAVSGQSTQLFSKVKDFRNHNTIQETGLENPEDTVEESKDKTVGQAGEEVVENSEQPSNYTEEDIKKKLEETQQAFEEAESKIE